MVIGTTSSSISKTEVFSKFSETQILKAVFPEIREIPCLMRSPLRVDRKPSFSIYMTNGGHIAWKDHAESGERGGLMDLLCKYWGCTFNQALDKICQLPELKDNIILKSKQIKTFTRKEASTNKKIEVKVRPWRDYDYEYWASYGIEKQWLKYAEIYPVAYKIVTKKDPDTGKVARHCFPADEYCYAYVERNYNLSETAVNELKRRYKKVFICYDTDAPGLKDAEKLAEQTGFINIVPDLKGDKDISDYFKSLDNKEDFKKLETLFH